MPAATLQTREDILNSLTTTQLKARIAELNARGHAITSTGNKPVLIQRILLAENPDVRPSLPALPTTTITAIDTQTVLAQTITVNNEQTKLRASKMLSGLSALAREIRETFDPNLENWRAAISSAKRGLRDANKLEAKFLNPVRTAIDTIKQRISKYELEQDRIRQAEARALEQAATEIAQASILDRIIELEDSGDSEGAQRLEQLLETGAIQEEISRTTTPVQTPVKTTGVSTRFVWRWKLLDITKLEDKYTVTIADELAITNIVNRDGDKADVGDGAIEVWKEAITCPTGR